MQDLPLPRYDAAPVSGRTVRTKSRKSSRTAGYGDAVAVRTRWVTERLRESATSSTWLRTQQEERVSFEEADNDEKCPKGDPKRTYDAQCSRRGSPNRWVHASKEMEGTLSGPTYVCRKKNTKPEEHHPDH